MVDGIRHPVLARELLVVEIQQSRYANGLMSKRLALAEALAWSPVEAEMRFGEPFAREA